MRWRGTSSGDALPLRYCQHGRLTPHGWCDSGCQGVNPRIVYFPISGNSKPPRGKG